MVVDLYAKTIVLHNYADNPQNGFAAIRVAQEFLPTRLPWIQAIVVKTRNSSSSEERRGSLVYETSADRKIRENGIWYALDPMLNRDASFYLDTRNVRHWAKENLAGKSVLNTFAYTGSLGVAAQAGGATRVVHLDLNRDLENIEQRWCGNPYLPGKSNYNSHAQAAQCDSVRRAGIQPGDCSFSGKMPLNGQLSERRR